MKYLFATIQNSSKEMQNMHPPLICHKDKSHISDMFSLLSSLRTAAEFWVVPYGIFRFPLFLVVPLGKGELRLCSK